MGEDGAAASASEPITTVTGGNKPLHRFLRGQPKSIGVALVTMGVCLFMFGIPVNVQTDVIAKSEMLSPFWLGILFFICGLLYIMSERNPSKKIITASLAMSVISTIGVFFACVEFIKSFSAFSYLHWTLGEENLTETDRFYLRQHYNSVESMEYVFFCHSLIGGVLLITMTFFSRAALRSSNTQTIVVMRDLPSAE